MNAIVRIAVHGGCGHITREGLGAGRETQARAALEEAVRNTLAFLEQGGGALDAVQRAVSRLEDCELFNAGRGSVLNADGAVEMDASVMDGATARCGAVGAVKGVRNPVALARAVLDDGAHVLLVAEGAQRFALEHGLAMADEVFLLTAERRRQLERARRAGTFGLDHDEHYGTVGAVARDARGHLAAATSTGGVTNKRPGRVGDSPLLGAGTWARDDACALSATGLGEHFVRTGFAHDVHARMRYAGRSLDRACEEALAEVAASGGRGGVIAVDREGNFSIRFNTAGMYRAWAQPGAPARAAIFPE